MKKIIAFILCLVLISGSLLSGFTMQANADGADKIYSIKATFKNTDKQNHKGFIMVGTALSVSDFEISARYSADGEYQVLNNLTAGKVELSETKIPNGVNTTFSVRLTYKDVADTVDGNEKVADVVLQVTNETLEKIEARWSGASTYYVGDSIKEAEITLLAAYKVVDKDGNIKDVTRTINNNYFSITPSAITADGANNITVEYENKKTSVQIRGYAPRNLDVSYSGDKNVIVGQSIDKKKVTAGIVYTNGDKKTVKNTELTITNEVVQAVGEHRVNVEYGGMTGTFSVTGVAKAPSKIDAKYSGTDLVVGSRIDISKITIDVTNNDKSKQTITSGFTISPDTITQIGTNTITVTYGAYTDTINIKGTEMLPSSIIATYNGGSVIEGAVLERSSISLTAYYPNGTNKTVTDFELSVQTMNTVGVQAVIVKHKGLESTIYVPVTARMVTDLSVVYNGGTPSQHSSLDREKIVVTATYNDGSTANISDYIINTTTVSKVGENIFTINYAGKRATLKIEAVARIISGTGSLESAASREDYSTDLKVYIQDQFIREGMALNVEDVEDAVIMPAIKRVNSTDKFVAFDMDVDDFQFDENRFMVAELTVPEGFNPSKVAVFFTPDRRKVMVQQTGGLVSKELYRFYVYKSGTYVIMEKEDNDVTKQELRDSEARSAFMVVSVTNKMKVGVKSKIKPYLLFSSVSDETYTYEVDEEDLMSISEAGEMTAKAAGTVTVTVTAQKSGFSESYEIEIEK